MCTYGTVRVPLRGAAKGRHGWFAVDDAGVYVDHPYFSTATHTLNLDFRDAAAGPDARVAVELSLESARELAGAIATVLKEYAEFTAGPG